MNAHQFAEWLAELLESTCERRSCSCNARAKADNELAYAADSSACAVQVVVTDDNGRTAEVVYHVGEWTYETEVDLPLLRRRLKLVEEEA